MPATLTTTSTQQTVGNARLSLILGTQVQTKLTVGAPNDVHEQETDRVADVVMRMPEPQSMEEAPTDTQLQSQSSQRRCPGCEKKLLHQTIEFGEGRYQPDMPQGRRLLAHELSHVVQQDHAAALPTAANPLPVDRALLSVQRDATNESILPSYAQSLDDEALLGEIDLVEGMLAAQVTSGEEHEVLSGICVSCVTSSKLGGRPLSRLRRRRGKRRKQAERPLRRFPRSFPREARASTAWASSTETVSLRSGFVPRPTQKRTTSSRRLLSIRTCK